MAQEAPRVTATTSTRITAFAVLGTSQMLQITAFAGLGMSQMLQITVYQKDHRTAGPEDHGTRGPQDRGTRATPGLSHTFAKKKRTRSGIPGQKD